MIEYHVDNVMLQENGTEWLNQESDGNSPALYEIFNNKEGNLTVEFPPGMKPLITLGHATSTSSNMQF